MISQALQVKMLLTKKSDIVFKNCKFDNFIMQRTNILKTIFFIDYDKSYNHQDTTLQLGPINNI